MCLDSVHFPFGSNDVFVRFQWASSYIIISMSVFFCHAKLIHNGVRIGIFWVCWHVDHHQLSICFDHLFASQQRRPQVLTTMAEQSPMRTSWVNTREHLGTKWEKGTIRKRDSMDLTGRRSTVQEVLRQSSFQFKELWNNLVSISTFPVPDTVGRC